MKGTEYGIIKRKVFEPIAKNKRFKRILFRLDLTYIRSLIRKIDPDVIHGHEVAKWGLPTVTLYDAPNIITVWGSDVFRFPKKSKRIFRNVKEALNKGDVIHVTNVNTKKYIMKEFDVEGDKFEIIPWGVDLNIFGIKKEKKVPDNINREICINDDDTVIIYPKGFRNIEMQNYITLLKAFSKIASDNNKLKLIMLSYGNDLGMKEIQEIIKRNKIEDQVYVEKEFLPIDQMADLYRMSDLSFIIEDTDEMSQSILESMGCGSIPVLSDISAYRMNFKEGTNCFYVSQKDENSFVGVIKNYLDLDQSERDRIISNNLKLVREDYNQEIQMPKILDMYKRLNKSSTEV